jgi:hypothetical protein
MRSQKRDADLSRYIARIEPSRNAGGADPGFRLLLNPSYGVNVGYRGPSRIVTNDPNPTFTTHLCQSEADFALMHNGPHDVVG